MTIGVEHLMKLTVAAIRAFNVGRSLWRGFVCSRIGSAPAPSAYQGVRLALAVASERAKFIGKTRSQKKQSLPRTNATRSNRQSGGVDSFYRGDGYFVITGKKI